MKKNKFQKLMLASLGMILIGTSAGLSTSEQVKAASGNQAATKDTLKVLFWSAEDFNRTYGEKFSKEYPNTDIQVVGPTVTEWPVNYSSAIEKYSPDLVMLPPSDYKRMSKDKKLTDLEPLIKRDNYDMTTLYPGLIAELKKQGGGNLYGLSHRAQSYALLYNVDLFKKYNVKAPSEVATWEEILKLASKFPTKGDKNTRIWGLSSTGSGNMVREIARTEGLMPMDPITLKATANTAAWKNAYRLAVEATKSGVLDERITLSAKSYLESSTFIMGRSAMTVASISQLQDLQKAKSGVKNYKPFTLGIAAGPADSKNRNSTGNYFGSDIFAIPAGAANVDAAWDFIQYFNGVDYAKDYYNPKASNSSISALSRMTKEYSGYKLDAFYKLRPNLDQTISTSVLSIKAPEFDFYGFVDSELKQVISGKKTLDKATAAIQSKTQRVADQLAKAQKTKK